MFRNFLINLFLLIPIWTLKVILFFHIDIKRKYIFDTQSQILTYLLPKFDLHNVKNEEIQDVRNLIEERRLSLRISKRPVKNITKIDHKINNDESLLLREYVPYKTDNENVILFFHGGGYVLNSVNTHDDMVSLFSEKLRTRIFSLDYKLSPENKFPVALQNSVAAFEWLKDKGVASEKISFCGDSAGAHLAASLTHYLSKRQVEIHSQFLIYPMCDPACNSESQKLFSEGYFLTQKAMEWFWNHLKSHNDNLHDDTFNLLKNTNKITAYHTFIVTAGFDPLHDEAEKYASILHNVGNSVKQLHYPSLFHGFASMTRLKTANNAVNDFLREYKKIL